MTNTKLARGRAKAPEFSSLVPRRIPDEGVRGKQDSWHLRTSFRGPLIMAQEGCLMTPSSIHHMIIHLEDFDLDYYIVLVFHDM